ncbi:MAG: ERCC4 domain-containing protein [Candidatus Hodarchaeales archaeon]
MSEERPRVIVDKREPEAIRNEFGRLGADVLEKTLSVADYIISDRIAIERKTGLDFVSSIMDGRLFEQSERLITTYEAPILLLENFESAFQREKMNPSAIYGALAFLARNLQLPIVPTADSPGTALFIYRLAYREQIEDKNPLLVRKAPKGMNLHEKQVFLLEGLERTGVKVAESLLNEFRLPMNVFRAIKETEVLFTRTGNPKGISGPLKAVKGIGYQFVERNKKTLLQEFQTKNAKKQGNLSKLIPDQEEAP